MNHYVCYISRVEGDKQFLEGKVELHHLLPPQIVEEGLHSASLAAMALHGLQATEGPKWRCDLNSMEMVPPINSVAKDEDK